MLSSLDAHLPHILATLPPERRHEVLNAVNYQRTREMTIDELLLENRVVFLIGEINYASAARVMMQMLYLENQKKGQDINFYINSPGGSVYAGLAIFDTMNFIKPDVSTLCVGLAASMGAFLLTAGTKGKRFALPNSRIMIHQPSGGAQGQATDIQIQAREILDLRARLNAILARNTGQPVERIEVDTERDNFMSSEDAVSYGLIDKVLVSRADSSATT